MTSVLKLCYKKQQLLSQKVTHDLGEGGCPFVRLPSRDIM